MFEIFRTRKYIFILLRNLKKVIWNELLIESLIGFSVLGKKFNMVIKIITFEF